jgi:hypothetical protein
MTNSERIEAYFNNELPDAEQQQLLDDVNSDPSLKSEFQFQQNVVDGIKAYRKKELIARLNSVQIASTGQALLLKTLGVIGIAGIATVSTFMWVNSNSDNETITDKTEIVLPYETEQPSDIAEATAPITDKKEDVQVTEPVVDKKIADKETTSKETTAETPAIVTPEVMEPDSSSDAILDDDLEAPTSIGSSEINLSTSTNVEVVFSKKYTFHYQVKEGQLTLYGDFEDAPFEVIEMKTNKGIKSYLYYKNHFYGLNKVSEDILPLERIENKAIIEELEKRR